MPPNPTRRRPRRALPLLVVAVLAAIVALPTAGVGPAAGQTEPLYTMTVSRTQALEDGEAIDVLLVAGSNYQFGLNGRIRVCRDGESYTSSADLDAQSGKCPDIPLSSSGTLTPVLYSAPDGSKAFRTFQVGIGTVQWGPSAQEPTKFSLTCDTTHPCRMVVDIADSRGTRRIIDSSTLLTFDDGSATEGCTGTAPDALSTSGPDRLGAAWVRWTRAACQADASAEAPTTGVFAGEGEGQNAFQTGFADLTYSAVGPTFDPVADPPTRSSVSVPIALNAAVIAVIGGYPSIAPDWPAQIPKTFEHLSLTYPELATMFGNSPFAFELTYETDVRTRNPELAVGPLFHTAKSVPMAPAGSDATTWFATKAFDALAPNQWVSSPIQIDGNVPNAPRGVHDSLAMATPPFSIAFVELYSSLAQLKKAAYAEYGANYGPIWVLTDYATATNLGLTTVAIPNANGEMVTPTPDSLRAAVPDLQLQPDGTYLPPDPGTSPGADGLTSATAPGAYPLTFVEHAVAPTEPLVAADCNARTGSQAQLASWLAFLTGAGQAALPPGMVPLTPELAARAAVAAAQVGAAPITGACAPTPPPPPDPVPTDQSTPGAPPSGLPTSAFSSPSSFNSPSGPRSASSGGVGGSGGLGGGAVNTDGGLEAGVDDGSGTTPDEVTVAEISYPDPTGGGARNGVTTALALVVLAVLVAVGGMLSSGRAPRTPGGRS